MPELGLTFEKDVEEAREQARRAAEKPITPDDRAAEARGTDLDPPFPFDAVPMPVGELG
jgi:hypothetical protein